METTKRGNASRWRGSEMIDWDRVQELREEVGAEEFAEVIELFLEEVDEKFVTRPKKNKPIPHNLGSGERRMGPSLRPLRTPRKVSRSGGASAAFQGDDLSKLAEGQQVEHHKFGRGRVESLQGSGPERKATVFFEQKGKKVLLLKYAKLRILS